MITVLTESGSRYEIDQVDKTIRKAGGDWHPYERLAAVRGQVMVIVWYGCTRMRITTVVLEFYDGLLN